MVNWKKDEVMNGGKMTTSEFNKFDGHGFQIHVQEIKISAPHN